MAVIKIITIHAGQVLLTGFDSIWAFKIKMGSKTRSIGAALGV
jgi:hypothetical protein